MQTQTASTSTSTSATARGAPEPPAFVTDDDRYQALRRREG
jgi:hypothetical protein